MRLTGVCHARPGRPSARWEDAFVKHVGVDWWMEAAEPTWPGKYDAFRNSVYQGYNINVPESCRRRSLKAGPPTKRKRVIPLPDMPTEMVIDLRSDAAGPRSIFIGDSMLVCT